MKFDKLLILMMIVIAPYTLALELTTNTNVTVDWIGNDMFYLRTESADYLINSSIQTDTKYQINITRHTETNQTEFEQIVNYMNNMTVVCSNLSRQLNFTSSFYQEIIRNDSICELDKAALMREVPVLESTVKNLTLTCTQSTNSLTQEKTILNSILTTCQTDLSNTTANLQAEKTSNSNKTILVVICVVIAGFLVIQEIQKKGKAHPDEMGLLSQT